MDVVEISAADTHDLRARVLRSHAPGLRASNPEDDLAGTIHLGVLDRGALIAVASFSPQDCPNRPGRRSIRLRGMAVEPSRQGTGVGSCLLARAIERFCGEYGPAEVVWAHARDTALGFYVRAGFEPVGASFDEAGLPHTTVVFDLVRSPAVETTIQTETADGTMEVFEARPDEPRETGRGVVVLQEAFGVNDHIEDVCRRLAAEGYHAVAPHLFHRTGGGTVPYGNFAEVLPHFEPLTDDRVLMDVDAALGVLAGAGIATSRTGVVGFCFGGRASFLVATRRKLGAAVGFYGGGIVTARFPQFPALISDVPRLQTPWLGVFGADDQSIPLDDVDRLRLELGAALVDTDVVVYERAGHGFFCDQRDSYAPEAAADAWPRMVEWFDGHLPGPGPTPAETGTPPL